MAQRSAKYILACILFQFSIAPLQAQFPRFKVLAFFSNKVERDHTDFSRDAIKFFKTLTKGNGFVFDTTSQMSDLNEQKLKDYSVVMMLNDFPHTNEHREAFTQYMEN